MHVHYAEDEMFLILEGAYRVCMDGEWTEVGPGSVVYLPRGTEHTFQVVGPEAGRRLQRNSSAASRRSCP